MKKIGGLLLAAFFLVGGGGAYYYFSHGDSEGGTIPNLGTQERASETLSETSGGDYGIAADNETAVDIGMNILADGGNAVDAAIAVSYALSVLEPYSSGMGGGGALLIQEAGKEPLVYDYLTTAPESGPLPENRIGVPGFVAGMERVHEDYGNTDMEKLISPSVSLAENGVPVDELFESRLISAAHRLPLEDLPDFYPNGLPLREGSTLHQPNLAESLQHVSEEGTASFYEGEMAETLASDVEGIEISDLAAYEVDVKEPVKKEVYGYDLYSVPGPSAGTMLIQSMKLAEMMNLEEYSGDQENLAYLYGEINRRTHYLNQRYIGDSEFSDVSESELVTDEFLTEVKDTIKAGELNQEYQSPLITEAEQDNDSNTTHLVVFDEKGTMVSMTNTISNFFGDGLRSGGFFMGNQLRNFNFSDESENAVEKGKRPITHIAPAIFSREDKPVLGVGSAGGRRIPSVMTQVLTESVAFSRPFQEAVEQPRMYLDVNEDVFHTEEGYSLKEREDVSVKGEIRPLSFGSVNGLYNNYDENRLHGSGDFRRNAVWKTREKEE